MTAPSFFTARIIVERYLAGVRIDTFLLRHFRNYTPFRMQRMVRAGCVRVDDVPVPIEFRVRRGQQVEAALIEPPDKLLAAEPAPLDILFEDPWLLVVNKPAGQIAHPVGLHNTGTLCNAVQHHLDRHTPRRGLLRPGIVHRIDRYTSGLIAVAKEHLSHRRLSIEFQRGRVAKEYLALVDGVLDEDHFTIDRPIGVASHPGCVLMSCRDDARDPRPAETRIEVVERFPTHTLVKALPLTGRNHQIRVHLAAIGHPIAADEFYAPFGQIKPTRFDPRDPADDEGDDSVADDIAAPAEPSAGEKGDRVDNADSGQNGTNDVIARHALHASRIRFRHPISREELEFHAPLADDMRAALDRLRNGASGDCATGDCTTGERACHIDAAGPPVGPPWIGSHAPEVRRAPCSIRESPSSLSKP